MPLDPQVEVYLKKLAAVAMPPVTATTPEDARAMMLIETVTLGAAPAVARIADRTIPGPAGEIRIRVTAPAGAGPFAALVFFHGGGWVVGSITTHDGLCRGLTNAAEVAVVSVDYRLAPEHKYPAAAEDAYAATAWVAEHGAEIGIDPRRISVGGDSTGGNLAAVVALMARDRGGPEIAHQLLLYPITDDDLNSASYLQYSTGYGLTREAMGWYWDQYAPELAARRQPYASPLRAEDLSGLPPALVVSAEYDVLRDEAEAYAVRLSEAGVAARLIRYDGLIHGFLRRTGLFSRARAALNEVASLLREALRGT